MTYHLYQRTITHNGKKQKVWYYWYYDSSNKQVRKSCGSDGKPCLIKRDAQAFIETLPPLIQEKKTITFNEFCKDFYAPDSRFILKQKARGTEYVANSLYQKNLYLGYFLDKFGSFNVSELKMIDIENWILRLPQCSSVKNHIIVTINEVYGELYNHELVDNVPLIQKFKRTDKKSKGILSVAEIQMLFPDNYSNIVDIWRIRSDETEKEIVAFATMIYTILSTGMRSCEVRALQWNQFIEGKALFLNAMFNSDDKRVNYLKKGDKENKKWRVVVLPQKTIKMLNNLRLYSDDKPEDFIFTYKGEAVTSDFLLAHFKLVLGKNGIEHDRQHRNITVHSLRFTYNTLMKNEVSEEDLRLMIGHASKQMTDYYDRSETLDHLPKLLQNEDRINKVFN